MKAKHIAVTIAVIFFITLIVNNNIEMAFDESRHAMQSVFFKQYFVTVLKGDYMPLPEFLALHMQKNQYTGWFALYDPPVHAILGGLFFLVFGISQFMAMASNALLIACSSAFFYLVCKDYFVDERKALVCYALFLFNPFMFYWSRIYRTELFVAFTFVAWYYFTFWKKERYFSLKLSNSFILRMPLMTIVGGIFLTISGLTKYPSMIWAGGIMVTHFLYTVYINRSRLRHESLVNFVNNTNLWPMSKKFLIQTGIFLLVGAWWMKFALYDYGMWDKAIWAGTIQGRERTDLMYYIYFPVAIFKEVYYITAFSVLAIYLAFKQKDDKKKLVFLSCLSVILIATFLISNRQLRYTFQFIPLFYLLSLEGLFIFSSYLKRFIKLDYFVWVALFMAFFGYMDYIKATEIIDLTGNIDYGIEKYISEVKDPSYFMNIKGHGGFAASRSVNGHAYKYTPDLFNFKLAKASKNYDDPKKIQRYVDIVYWWDQGLSTRPELIINKLVELSAQIDVYLVLYRFDDPKDNIISSLREPLLAKGFMQKETDYYLVLYKTKS